MIQLTPDHLAATYDCMRAFKPFKQWKLPESDAVEFAVIRNLGYSGFYIEETRKDGIHHIIQISNVSVGYFDSLAKIMAHEMIHLHQAVSKTYTRNVMHNPHFHYHARRLCNTMGWDYLQFV